MKTKITELLGIKYRIIQGGMAWTSDANLAAAVSNAGGAGIIATGGRTVEWTRDEIRKAKDLTAKPFGVNIMLMAPNIAEIIDVVCEEKVAFVTLGAGNPVPHIEKFHAAEIKVIPVVPSVKLAKRVEEAGVDAMVIEGMEGGGHIGQQTTIGYSVYTPLFESGEISIITDLELAGSTFTIIPTKDTGVLTGSKVNPLFDGTKSQIDAMLPANATTYDKVKAVHDKICSMVSYENNMQNIGNPYYQTPYSLYYDADGDGKIETVCAGYAKMMKLQCNKYGIPCVLVTGVTDSGEYHMWNYVQMENGVWYAVDVSMSAPASLLSGE